MAAQRDDGAAGVDTLVVEDDDVQLVAMNALTTIGHHRASSHRQRIDIPGLKSDQPINRRDASQRVRVDQVEKLSITEQ